MSGRSSCISSPLVLAARARKTLAKNPKTSTDTNHEHDLFSADGLRVSLGGDYNGFLLRIVIDRLVAVFFSETALLHSAKGELVIDDLRRVDPGIAGFDPLRSRHGSINVSRPYGGTQTEDGIVCLLDGVVQILNPDDRKGRTEALFLQNSRGRIDVGKKRRLQVEPLIVIPAFRPLGAVKHPCPALDRLLDLFFNLLPLAGSVEGSHKGVRLEPVTDSELFHLLDQFLHEYVGDLVEQIKPLDSQTGLAAVEESANRSGAHRPIEIRVVANDHRIAAAQFQGHVFKVFGSGLHHAPARVGGAGKADLTHRGIYQQFFANDASRPCDGVDDSFGTSSRPDRFID